MPVLMGTQVIFFQIIHAFLHLFQYYDEIPQRAVNEPHRGQTMTDVIGHPR